jgi:predicted MFS family arabinose efflux permease
MLRSRLAESTRAFRDAFANPALRRLELALAGSVIGDWAFSVALAVYAYRQGGAATLGLVSMTRWLLAAAAAPFIAVLADRYRRRRVMISADLLRAITVGGAALAAATGGPALAVYFLAVLTSIIATAFPPAQTALIPSLTRTPEEMTAANVVTSSIDSVGTFAGPAIGGLVLATAGTGTVFALDAATFVWSMLLVAAIHAPDDNPRPREEAGSDRSESLAGEALAGFRVVGADSRLRLIIGLFGAQTIVSGALSVMIVVMAIDLLSLGNGGVGTLNAAVGVGGVVGSMVAFALVGRGKLASDFALGLVAWGLPIALIGVWANASVAVAMLVVVGIGNTLVDVAGLTLLQRVVPDEVLGRVFGVLESVFAATIGLGAVLAPLLIHLAGTRAALLIVGALLPLLTAVTWPMLMRIDRGAADPARLALLRQVPFMAPLQEATLERLTRQLAPVSAAAGETVFLAGDQGDRFYLVERGEVEVVSGDGVVARLGAGGYFGEIALVRDVPRTASIRVPEGAELLALDRDEFIAAVTGHAPSAAAADAVVSARMTGLRAAGLGRV